ncbi:hypothetical protein [Paenibacillus sp. NEAU-GSW1]|uniref:hypothetical protein n=1 Tax=Paenibacillus sp. NEAU-GSW1 TaxID=2682486 RepID=UPI0012E19DA7|nr:hypothetical protein [Paenibacillus sp. NEAU-GSW1]MUT65209.1 hypothetical protein [Paenibacillus sp. NEAU-GSW1]
MAYAFVIEPNAYTSFEDEAAQIEKCKEWGLLSEKATKTKPFYYKGNGLNEACTIVGYADSMTAVISLGANAGLHCIHPSYLKEMQASNYGVKAAAAVSGDAAADSDAESAVEADAVTAADVVAVAGANADAGAAVVEADKPATDAAAAVSEAQEQEQEQGPKAKPAAKPKKEKAPKLELPEEKVKMVATVQEFTTVPNHFSDTDDEVIIYEAVAITEPMTEIGTAWSSHSATIKKLELQVGDTIQFEAKIVAKKLTKHPVPYKINNPAKIVKAEIG